MEDLICEFFKKEVIADFKCEKCKQNSDISKTHDIIHYPKLLIINVKRFVMNPYPKKLSNKIAIQEEIDLSNFYVDSSFDTSTPAKNFFINEKMNGNYKLKCFVEHYGEINYGHYIAYCYNNDLDKWVLYNDEKISEIDNPKFIENSASNVYVLFYERI